MKIVHIETILNSGPYASSTHWAATRKRIHSAVRRCAWPPGSKKFTIYPQSGKKRGEGNGVVPIKKEFIEKLRKLGWTIEGKAKNHLGQDLGDFDAVLPGPLGPVVVEWETGNKHQQEGKEEWPDDGGVEGGIGRAFDVVVGCWGDGDHIDSCPTLSVDNIHRETWSW